MTWWEEGHKQTFSYAIRTGMTTSGGPEWGAPQTGSCRHVRRIETVRSIDEEEVIVTDTFETSVGLKQGDRVWRPGDATTAARALTVKSVIASPDLEDPNDVLTTAKAG